MPVESVNVISDLNANYPTGQESISSGDDHIRNVKKAVKNTFPNIDKPVTVTADQLNRLESFQGNGVFASCKFSGRPIELKYAHNVSNVEILSNSGYRVWFVQPTDGFDHHYSVQITPVATTQRPVTCQVTDQRAEWIAFTTAEWNGYEMGAPMEPIGFYMTMVDMIQVEQNASP